MTYIKMIYMSLLPVILSILLYLVEKKGWAKKLGFWPWQILTGTLFGGLAVMATEYGVSMDGYVLNARDAAPLCAGLIFGGPAGIIAGGIGGVERWFSVYWGVGSYTRAACSISTILAGLVAAGLRIWLFDDKRPSWTHGLAIGIAMEVLHMLMVFVMRMEDAAHGFEVVRFSAKYMIAMNSLSVALALFLVSLIGKDRQSRQFSSTKNISQTFQSGILISVVMAFLTTSLFTYVLQTKLFYRDYADLILLNINDIKSEVDEQADKELLEITRRIAKQVDLAGVEKARIDEMLSEFLVSEINIIDENDTIIKTTDPQFLGYDMNSGIQSKAFSVLNSGEETEFVQPYQNTSYDRTVSMKYAGVALKDGGYVQAGYNSTYFREDIGRLSSGSTANRHIGKTGYIIISTESGKIVSGRADKEGAKLPFTGIKLDHDLLSSGKSFTTDVYGVKSLCISVYAEGYYIIGVVPIREVVFSRDIATYILAFMEIVVYAALFIHIYFLVKTVVVDNMRKINGSLARITGGDLNTMVNVRSNQEFASLSDDINSTVGTLKHYISEAAARLDQELEFAKSIQHSALPSVFPPYPDRKDFEIYALMDTAKEVGGDFYDFYLLDGNKLVFMIADVSGKGIPAAMFMMTAKTQIKSLVESGMSVEEAFTTANNKLCESNEAGMFVTAWMGMVDLGTGKLLYANAGHNPPLVRRRNGAFEYLRTRPNFVLAGMEGARYRKNEMQLHPGDEIFLYTDGVTEATKTGGELWGEERLHSLLGSFEFESLEAMCNAVKAGIDDFVGEADQFDDITMVALKTNWFQNENSITTFPDMESVSRVAAFAEEFMDKNSVPMKLVSRLMVAIDEIYSNIVLYSGAKTACMRMEKDDAEFTMTFIDDGKPYDPTETAAPDITASIEDRQIGGLGIFMVKNMAKSMEYERVEEKNILTTVFELESFRKPKKS